MVGQHISHYKILEKLGEGGMGIVYKAHDTKLDRDVALKFLPRTLSPLPEDRDRFIHEAKAASALDHPNICTIYEVDEISDGHMFIAMGYYEGILLSKRIEESRLGATEAVGIAVQIAEGLKAAHQKGIVHRDIKSSNIMITNDGQVKILDFGLARKTGLTKLTRTGSPIGTAAYMSPEQARGETIDHRTDLWSLGVILYEMLTGKLPFRGEHEAAILYSVVNEEPLPIKSAVPDISPELLHIVKQCLEKEREKRYQSAKELTDELQRLQDGIKGPKRKRPIVNKIVVSAALLFILTGLYLFWPSKQPPIVFPQTDQEKSIIVLPFENISPDKENNEYISDGFTEAVNTELSRIKDLFVISQHASMTFKGTKKKTADIADEVNVRYVLEGSVRREGDNLRIAAKLIDATNDRNLWAETYPGILNEVLDMQDKVARAIVDALSLKLSPEESNGIFKRPIDNAHVYDLYLKARAEILNWNEESFDKAKRYLTDALKVSGPNATLYGEMAVLYWYYGNQGFSPEENIVKAEEYVQKAFDLDPQVPEAHLALGLIHQNFRADIKKSIFHLKAVLVKNPYDFDALIYLMVAYAEVGRLSAVRVYVDKMMKADPISSISNVAPAFASFYAGQFDSTLGLAEKCFRAEPNNGWHRMFYPIVLVYNGRIDNAKSILGTYPKGEQDDINLAVAVLLRQILEGNQVNIRLAFSAGALKIARMDPQNSQFISQVYAIGDHKQEALDWLENAINRGFINYPLIAEHDPFFRKFKDDKRFIKLTQRMKTEWENFKD
jgi:eukaryotic-like serine/threonine-protein kinase